ncbi:MAG: hypothetical protein HY645_07275, partial [Acidobacteria bacterium]|nr:hypothetical protein [Acidobacteriota bacterium]
MSKLQSCQLMLVLLLVCAIGLWPLTTAQAQAPDGAKLEQLAVYPTLIVYNGKIGAMDQNLTFHQAMAIRGDRIWRLGTNQEIRELAGPQTELIDLKGRTVVPGLIDVHTHVHLWGWWHFGGQILPELEPAYAHGKDLEEVKLNLARGIQQRIQKQGKDKWVIASVPTRMGGELQKSLQQGRVWPVTDPARIRREEISRLAPDTPVMIVS